MKGLILTFVFLSGLNAVAQNTTSTELSTVQPALTDNISIDLDLSQSSNQFAEEQAEAVRSTDLEMIVSKKLASENKVKLRTLLTHKNTGPKDTVLSDTTIIYSLKPKEVSRDSKTSISVRAILPTSKKSSEETKLNTAVSLRATMVSKKQLLSKSLTLSTYIDGLKYSHKFIRDPDGEDLMDYRVRTLGFAEIELSSKVVFGVVAYYQAGETYQNTLKAAFLIKEELSYTPKKDGASYYLAHTNDGNALGPNGQDSEIKAYDSSSSVFSAGVRATF